jgi:hypothetical protein
MTSTGLFGSTILEVAIGLFFVYLLLSLICSSINEFLASLLKWRAENLEQGLQNLICDPTLFDTVMAHPLIKALGTTRTEAKPIQLAAGQARAGKPSYIPSRVFALALLDSLRPAGADRLTVAEIQSRAQELAATGDARQQQIGGAVVALVSESRNPQRVAQRVDDLKQMVEKLSAASSTDEARQLKELAAVIAPARTLGEIEQAVVAVLPAESGARRRVLAAATSLRDRMLEVECDLGAVQQSIARWYDDAMDRASGVYKRKIQMVLVVIALVVSGTLGADSLRIVTTLSVNPALRVALAEEAVRQAGPGGALVPNAATAGSPPSVPSVSALAGELVPFSALFGYSDMPTFTTPSWWGWLIGRLVGILMTVAAVSLGAPFWFDVLNKVANLRGTGQRPATAATQDTGAMMGVEGGS